MGGVNMGGFIKSTMGLLRSYPWLILIFGIFLIAFGIFFLAVLVLFPHIIAAAGVGIILLWLIFSPAASQMNGKVKFGICLFLLALGIILLAEPSWVGMEVMP